MGNGRDHLFACAACGSPAIALPPVLTPTSTVCCGGCGRALMAWGDFCERAEAAAGRMPPGLPSERPETAPAAAP